MQKPRTEIELCDLYNELIHRWGLVGRGVVSRAHIPPESVVIGWLAMAVGASRYLFCLWPPLPPSQHIKRNYRKSIEKRAAKTRKWCARALKGCEKKPPPSPSSTSKATWVTYKKANTHTHTCIHFCPGRAGQERLEDNRNTCLYFSPFVQLGVFLFNYT